MKHVILSLAIIPFLAACGGVGLTSKSPAPTYYMLHPTKYAEDTKLPYSIILEEPSLAPGLDTDRIALTKQQGRVLDYYAGGHWPEPLDKVLHDFFTQSLEPIIPLSPRRSETLLNDEHKYRLMINVHDFQAEYEHGPESVPNLHVSFNVSLVDQGNGKIVRNFSIEKLARARSNTLTDVTQGLEDLLRGGVDDMISKFPAQPPTP